MQNALVVRRCHRCRALPSNPHRLGHRHARHAAIPHRDQPCKQRLAFDKLHQDVDRAVADLVHIEDAHDARMVDQVDGACLIQEPRDVDLVLGVGGELAAKDLHRGAIADGSVRGLVDYAHATTAKLADDLVVAYLLTDQAG